MQVTIPYAFTPRAYQLPFLRAMDSGIKRACWVVHRRGGKDKTAVNFTAKEMFKRVGSYYHCLPTYNQARKVLWDAIDKDGFRMMDHIPESIRLKTNNSEMKITTANGSIWQAIGADNYDAVVGANPVGIVFSEWAVSDNYPKAWDYFRPILAENGGWAVFIYTPRGRNHGFSLYQDALRNPNWFCQLLTVGDTQAIAESEIQKERDAGMSEDMIQQEFYCFPPLTPILTNAGLIPVESVRVNDNVLTHAGRYRPVVETMCREYQGDLIKIETYGNYEPLCCTPNHSIRVYNSETQTYKWKPAGEVKRGDYAVMPRIKTSDHIISKDLAILLAWYVAEGSFSKNAVQFTLNKSEKEYQTEIITAAKSLGYEPKISESPTATNIVICNTRLCDFFLTECGTLAENKRIPLHLISGHEKIVFDTLMKGDGCVSVRKSKAERISYTTISKTLAYGFQILCSTLGYSSGISVRPARESTIEGRQVMCAESYQVQGQVNGRPTKIRPTKHGCAVYVSSVKTTPYSGKVYNLKVKYDESYIASGRVVHNCSFLASNENIVIPFNLIQGALSRQVDCHLMPRYAGCDPARFGNDRTGFVIRQAGEITHVESWRNIDTVQVAGKLIDRYRTKMYDAIAIDVIGIGSGVFDMVKNAGVPCVSVNVAEAPATEPERFARLRDQLWWSARKWFSDMGCSIASTISQKDKDALVADIQDIRFSYTPIGKIIIESKDDMKERLKFSPDLGDALCMTFAPNMEMVIPYDQRNPFGQVQVEVQDTLSYDPLRYGLRRKR